MWNFNCRYCRAHLQAYIDGELSLKSRRRVSQHLDRCPACYSIYVQQRDLSRELRQSIPMVGQRGVPDFKQMWGAIQAELPQPQPRLNQARYGLALLAFTLMLIVPFTMGHRDISLMPPSPPAPQLLEKHETPDVTEPAAVATAAASITVESEMKPATLLPTVPEPRHQESSRGIDGNTN
jgi:anti-sigma factor RsiW